jgi:hypothetical protein
MNGYDLQVVDAIQRYHHKHGAYPEHVEATPEFLQQLSQTTFSFQEVDTDTEVQVHRIHIPQYRVITIPVIPIEG